MPWMFDQLLHIYIGAAKCLLGLGARRVKHRYQLVLIAYDAHPAPAPALGGLDHDGIANFRGDTFRRILIGNHARTARNDWQSCRSHGLASFVFLTHQPDGIRSGTNEGDMRSFADFGEIGVFRKKSIAGMNGIHIRDFRGADHLRNVQVTLAAARRPDANCFVGKANVQGIAISFGIDGDGLDAEFPASRQNTKGDFAAIGDSKFSEHWAGSKVFRIFVYFFRFWRMPKSGSPYSTGCPFSTNMRTTSPATSDSISFISFIASIMHKACPDSTL